MLSLYILSQAPQGYFFCLIISIVVREVRIDTIDLGHHLPTVDPLFTQPLQEVETIPLQRNDIHLMGLVPLHLLEGDLRLLEEDLHPLEEDLHLLEEDLHLLEEDLHLLEEDLHPQDRKATLLRDGSILQEERPTLQGRTILQREEMGSLFQVVIRGIKIFFFVFGDRPFLFRTTHTHAIHTSSLRANLKYHLVQNL